MTHVGRPDEQLHRFGAGEALLIVQGHHGYISPSNVELAREMEQISSG